MPLTETELDQLHKALKGIKEGDVVTADLIESVSTVLYEFDNMSTDCARMAKALNIYANPKNWSKLWDHNKNAYSSTFDYVDGAKPAFDILTLVAAAADQGKDQSPLTKSSDIILSR